MMTAHTIHRGVIAAAVLITLAAAPGVRGAQAGKIDVTGTWVFEVQTNAGGGTPTVTFKQDGETLTGHYSSTNLGEADLTGAVRGTDIGFTFTADVQGTAVAVAYKGTIESNTAMKGTISIAGLGDGTFTATRK
jgi:hypothetical protein